MAYITNRFLRATGNASMLNSTDANIQQAFSDSLGVTALANGTFVVVWNNFNAVTGADEIRGTLADALGNAIGTSFLISEPVTYPSGVTHASQFDPHVTPAANGGFMVTWTSTVYNGGYNTGRDVLGRVFDANGVATNGPFTVANRVDSHGNVITGSWEIDSATATLTDGRIAVAYQDDQQLIGVRLFNADGSFANFALQPNAVSAVALRSPDIAALSNGGFVVTWQGSDASGYGINARLFDAAGQPTGAEFIANASTENNQYAPRVAGLANGRFVIIYANSWNTDLNDFQDRLQGQVFNANGTPFGGEFTVRPGYLGGVGHEHTHDLVALPDGGFMLLYDVSTAKYGNIYGDYDVYAQRYNAAGTALGPEMRLNGGDPNVNDGNQVRVHGEAQPDGNVLVSWVSESTGAVLTRVLQIADYNGQPTAGDDFIAFGNAPQVIGLLAGNDAATFGTGADQVWGAAGNDTIQGGLGNDSLFGGIGADEVWGEAGNDSINGGDGADVLNGGTGDDFIFGGDSAADLRDVIYGGDGNDSVNAGYGNDQVYAGNGNDSVDGSFGADEIVGQAGNDVLTGGALSDLIFGGDGNDFINGGFGFDRVNGGAGADVFFHFGSYEHGSDWVQDYTAADGDVLRLGSESFPGSAYQVVFAETPNAGQAGVQEAFVVLAATQQILWALVDGGAQAQINLQIGTQVFDLLV